jgi:hypothetical protein
LIFYPLFPLLKQSLPSDSVVQTCKNKTVILQEQKPQRMLPMLSRHNCVQKAVPQSGETLRQNYMHAKLSACLDNNLTDALTYLNAHNFVAVFCCPHGVTLVMQFGMDSYGIDHNLPPHFYGLTASLCLKMRGKIIVHWAKVKRLEAGGFNPVCGNLNVA